MSKKNARWLKRALKAASEAQGGYRLGAVAVRGGKHLGAGANRWRNDPHHCPGLPREAWSTHAEEACLRAVGDADGATLYVVRITPGGRWAMARPCESCWDLIARAGVSRVVYTTGLGVVEERIAA